MTRNIIPDGEDATTHNKGFSRRRLIQTAGLISSVGLLGIGVTGTVDGDDFHAEFANRRVQEAMKAWSKGFRGQPDRTLGVLGTGLEARHPDLGPWNGVRAIPNGDNSLELVQQNFERLDVPDRIRFFEGSFAPNAGNARHEHQFTAPADVNRVEAHLRSYPFFVSNNLLLLLETADGEVVKKDKDVAPHAAIAGQINPGERYVFAVETNATGNFMATEYDLEANYLTDNPNDHVTDPFLNITRNNITPDTPKVVGWYNEDSGISERTAKPRGGPNRGHGTHLASVMAGSGRASTVDETTVTEETPNKVLFPGDVLKYEVDAAPGRGIYGVAFGKNIEVAIFGPNGERLDHHHLDSTLNRTPSIAEHPTIHKTGTETYNVQVTKREESFRVGPSEGASRVNRVSVGSFKDPGTTTGDRTDADETPTLHAGIAPNSGLVGISGYLKTREDMQHLADDFAQKFNLRVLDVKVGFAFRPGIVAGSFSAVEAIKALANAGILTVSRTGDQAPAYHKDRATANTDEAISVAQAGPWDGIYTLSNSEPGAIDEDGEGAYRKPDVTALGSKFHNRVKSAKQGDPFRSSDEQSPIRDYDQWGQVSTQHAFVAGMAGLVAQALETEAPSRIALPPPAEAGFSDTMRLKQTILATASETAFTAAGWHRRSPQYNYGGHDPIEGWGRVNIDTAVEAATRDFTPDARASTKIDETVGLDIPRHSRAVAGYISGTQCLYKVSINFSKYTGEDREKAAGPPHLDLFVYDAENPAPHGTPNIEEKAKALKGSATLQFSASRQTEKGTRSGTYYVVAKLVNVPGAVNSDDIQAHFNLTVRQIDAITDNPDMAKTDKNEESGGNTRSG